MLERPLSPDALRTAATEITRATESRAATAEALDAAARVVAEALLDQAEHRAPTASQSVVDGATAAAHLDLAAVALPSGKPLEILRGGPRNVTERALVATLLARHLHNTLQRRDGVSALRAMLPSLDWLEFVGQYPPYTAARFTLADADAQRLHDVTAAAPVEAPTALATEAVRALRGVAAKGAAPARADATEPDGAVHEVVVLSGELEGYERALWWRLLTVMASAVTGALRAALRVVFSLRSPTTVTLDGDQVRIAGHTELLGRTLREYDLRFPLHNLTEVRREARFPMLPVAASVFALFVGSTFGAKFMIEGAGGRYWVLVALGLGLIAAGVLFDFLVRAVFPGVTGRTRLVLRAGQRRGMVLTGLDTGELDRLLTAMEARLTTSRAAPLRPLLSGAEALSDTTVRDPTPARGTRRAR